MPVRAQLYLGIKAGGGYNFAQYKNPAYLSKNRYTSKPVYGHQAGVGNLLFGQQTFKAYKRNSTIRKKGPFSHGEVEIMYTMYSIILIWIYRLFFAIPWVVKNCGST